MTKNSQRLDASVTLKRMNSFFAGIGGFDLAFEAHGFVPTFHCENNDFCRSVLRRHWPEVINAPDIRHVDAEDIPAADVWTAGFPCQDLSLARTPHGKRSGLNGTQSGLFHRFVELLSVCKPPVVLLENVAGLLNSHDGRDFTTLITSLTGLGYAVAWRVLNARYFGVPQSRPRVFVCAWRGAPAKAVEALFEPEVVVRPTHERRGFMVESTCPASGISVPQVSFCISATSGRHTGLDWARSYVSYPQAVRRLTPVECERLQGLPDDWTTPAQDYTIPVRGIETSRYHAIGNAVCVPVARWVAGRISTALRTSDVAADTSTVVVRDQLQRLASARFAPAADVQELRADAQGWKWRSGGIACGDWFITAAVSSSPSAALSSRFIDVIEKTKVHERYFLSGNAAQGILRRVDKLGRHLFPPLDAVLRQIAGTNRTTEDETTPGASRRELAVF